MEWITRSRDKATMARAFQARASMGKVYLPKKPWAADLLSELLKFPAGKHDDIVDTCALLGLVLDEMITGSRPKPSVRRKLLDRWDKAFSRQETPTDTWRTV